MDLRKKSRVRRDTARRPNRSAGFYRTNNNIKLAFVAAFSIACGSRGFKTTQQAGAKAALFFQRDCGGVRFSIVRGAAAANVSRSQNRRGFAELRSRRSRWAFLP